MKNTYFLNSREITCADLSLNYFAHEKQKGQKNKLEVAQIRKLLICANMELSRKEKLSKTIEMIVVFVILIALKNGINI